MAEECRTARLLPAVVMLALMSFHDQNVHSNRETCTVETGGSRVVVLG